MALIKESLEKWEGAEEEALAEALKGLLCRFTDQTNVLLGRIAADCEALFGVKFDLFVPEEDLPADTRFYHGDWFVADGIDLAIGVAMTFLPKSLIRRRILAETSRGMAGKLNMERGGLRYDFVRRIEARVREFTASMDDHLARAIRGIREVVEKTLVLRQEREEEAVAARARVEDQLARYSALEARLRTICDKPSVQAPLGRLAKFPRWESHCRGGPRRDNFTSRQPPPCLQKPQHWRERSG